MTNHLVVLSISNGPLQGREYVFRRPLNCMVGRGSGCLVRLPYDASHNCISRRHCVFRIDPPNVYVRDLESTNGTFVNGARLSHGIKPMKLSVGDEVSLAYRTIIHLGRDEVDEDSLVADVKDADYFLSLGICPPCFEIARTPNTLVIRFVGRMVRLESSFLQILDKHVENIVDSTGCPHIALIMSNIECVDSQTIGAFMKLHQKLGEMGGGLRLARTQPHVHEVLQAAELYDVFGEKEDL